VASQASSDTPGSPPRKPRVFYVSYDGMGEPLGRSQVLAYLFRLAADYDITLFSFEKRDADVAALANELRDHGIRWLPLRYHKRPPVLATLLDAVVGWRAMLRAARTARPDIVHVRSYVPALIALWARPWTTNVLLFDIRGFWADERVEGGIWPSERLVYRALYSIAKWCESRFFARAQAVVTLTHASIPHIRRLAGRPDLAVEVIPTCVDLERFIPRPPNAAGPRLTWSGSVGTWYRFDLVPPLAGSIALPLQVLTRQTELAHRLLNGMQATVCSLTPDEVPGALCSGDVGLSLCVSSFSKVASAPTRFAEYLAAGMPVVVTTGVGDVAAIVEQYEVGVVLRGEDEEGLRDAATRLRLLLKDKALPARCRMVASQLFDVKSGSRSYAEIYDRLLRSNRRS
jgi:glycosyltransferase involved in cell wall biosynthesis